MLLPFVTADQLVAHAIGDYWLQSDWMASEKTKKSLAALAHVVTYTLPFLFLTLSWKALVFIAVTHFIIDRWRLARYICWLKNYLAPKWKDMVEGISVPLRPGEIPERVWAKIPWNPPWEGVKNSFGYPPDKPAWLAGWLLFITDNIAHVLCNAIALKYFA